MSNINIDITSNIRISIIIINYNDINGLNNLFKSLNTIESPELIHQIIILDDGSIPRLIDQSIFLEDHFDNVIWLYESRRPYSGRARARNLAASYATGDYLIFVDGDVKLPSSFIRHYHYLIDTMNVSCVLGSHTHDISTVTDPRVSIFKEIRHVTSFDDLTTKWVWFWSNNFLIKKDIWNQLKGMDESFLGWGVEDIEFGYRLLLNNVPIIFIENNAVIVEPHNQSMSDRINNLHNLFKMAIKHNDVTIMDYCALHNMICDMTDFKTIMFPTQQMWTAAYLAYEFRTRLYKQHNKE